MVPEDGFDYCLIGSISLFPDNRIPTFRTPHSSEYPPLSFVVGRIRSHEVASLHALVASVADVARPNSVERLRRIRVSHRLHLQRRVDDVALVTTPSTLAGHGIEERTVFERAATLGALLATGRPSATHSSSSTFGFGSSKPSR